MTTIVVVGDVTPERAKEVVGNYFGGWKAEGPKPETDLPPVPSNAASSAAVPDASRVQDEVMLAETLGVTRGHPDYYTLQVGNHVLAGAFYATRLYRDLREETGLVYVVQAMLDAGKTRAAYSVFYGCDPGNVSKARALVERDLREMQTKPVSADELRQAKTLLIRKIPLVGVERGRDRGDASGSVAEGAAAGRAGPGGGAVPENHGGAGPGGVPEVGAAGGLRPGDPRPGGEVGKRIPRRSRPGAKTGGRRNRS